MRVLARGRDWRRSEMKGNWRVRRVGVVALALLFTTIAVALLLSHEYRLGIAPTSVAILVGGGTLTGVYLAWVTYRDSQAGEEVPPLAPIADELAAAVADQWQREAAIRHLNDPYPLPVRWVPADPPLSDEWGALVTLASSGAGWPVPAKPWAAGPSELAGGGNQLADVLVRVPTNRLVVLGEPGSGKTMLMVRLVLDLLERRSKGDVVPVLLSAASWNPLAQGFHSWVRSQLLIAHPALAAPCASGDERTSRVDALLQARLIMPILDGFDELPAGVRGQVISRVNGELKPGERLVMTSRTTEYRAATRPAVGVEITLAAAAVELCPVDLQDVIDYLRQSSGGPRHASRWDNVFIELTRSRALAHVLSSPLMVGLARAIYNKRPDELTVGRLPDPADLCTFTTRESIEGHLLDAFIPAAYRSVNGSGPISCEWNPERAERWLSFFADYLERVVREPALSWWDLNIASPAMTNLASGIIAGIAAGLPIILIPLLLVTVSFVQVRLASTPGYSQDLLSLLMRVFQQYGDRIVLLTLLLATVGGIAGLTVALGPLYEPWAVKRLMPARRNNRHRVMATIFIALFYAVIYSLVAYFIAQAITSWPYYIDTLGALAIGVTAARASINKHFRMRSLAVIVIGAIVGAPFLLYENFSRTEYANIGFQVSLIIGLLAGMAAGAVLVRAQTGHYPSRSIRWSPRSAIIGLLVGGTIVNFAERGTGQISLALAFGAVVGLGTAVIFGLERVPGNLGLAASPKLVLRRDRSATLTLCTVIATTSVLAIGVTTFVMSSTMLLPDISPTADAAIFGLTIGPTAGFAFGFVLSGYGSSWPQWVIARQILAIQRKIPLRLMAFLEDSHARGVLRQVGPTYQFRHIELQHRLASRIGTNASPSWLQQEALAARRHEHRLNTDLRPFKPLGDKRTLNRKHALLFATTILALAVMATTTTLIYRNVSGRTGIAGQQSSSLVPVVTCPSVYSYPRVRPVRVPAMHFSPEPRASTVALSYYTDMTGVIPMILGPRGWACSAIVYMDGGWTIDIHPHGESAASSVGIRADGSSCIGCVYTAACPLISHVTAELSFYKMECPEDRTPRQVVSWVVGSPKFSASGNDVVSILDPPEVKGYVARSGGRYSARGILLYFWGLPGYYDGYPSFEKASGAMAISCTLPTSGTRLCSAILAAFRLQG
jgi:hypothetical protein